LNESGIARLASETIRKRALDDVLGAPVRGKLFETQLVGLFANAKDRGEHVFKSRDRAPLEDPNGLPFNSVAQVGVKAVARRQIDARREAFLQDRLDVNQIERVESHGRVSFDEYVHVAGVASRVARGRPEEIERPHPARSDLG